MRRTSVWVWLLLGIVMVCALLEYMALATLIPSYAIRTIRQTIGEAVTIGGARMRFPFTLVLTDIRFEREWPLAGFHVKRVFIKPSWAPWKSGTIALRAVDVEELRIRISRTRKGTLLWPAVPVSSSKPQAAVPTSAASKSPVLTDISQDRGGLSVQTMSLVDGRVTFLDEQITRPFYGALDHISIVAGPLTWPPSEEPVALAVRGEIVGHGGHAAPIYCSGWLDLRGGDLETVCQLEPLALAAFEPYYYQGRLQARVYEATLEATSQWSVKSHALEGQIQLTIANLDEGDLSIRGSTLVDIQQLAEGAPPILTGEVKVSGPAHDLSQWQLELVPGNEIVQRLMKPLLNRGREIIRVRLGGETIKVGISDSTEAEMSGIEETSKQAEESLEVLTTHLPEKPPVLILEEPPVSEEQEPISEEVVADVQEEPPSAPSDQTSEPATDLPGETTPVSVTPEDVSDASE